MAGRDMDTTSFRAVGRQRNIGVPKASYKARAGRRLSQGSMRQCTLGEFTCVKITRRRSTPTGRVLREPESSSSRKSALLSSSRAPLHPIPLHGDDSKGFAVKKDEATIDNCDIAHGLENVAPSSHNHHGDPPREHAELMVALRQLCTLAPPTSRRHQDDTDIDVQTTMIDVEEALSWQPTPQQDCSALPRPFSREELHLLGMTDAMVEQACSLLQAARENLDI